MYPRQHYASGPKGVGLARWSDPTGWIGQASVVRYYRPFSTTTYRREGERHGVRSSSECLSHQLGCR